MIIEFNALNCAPRQVVIDTKDIYLDQSSDDSMPEWAVCCTTRSGRWIVSEETFAYLRAFMLTGGEVNLGDDDESKLAEKPPVYRVEDSLNGHPYMLKNVQLMSDDVLEQYEAWNKSVTAKGGNKTIWTKP